MSKIITKICESCGHKLYRRRVGVGTLWFFGKCDKCRKTKAVTYPQDFFVKW